VLKIFFFIPETFEQSSGRSRQENVYHATKDTSDDTKEKEKEVNTLGRTRRAHIYCTVSICRLAGKPGAGCLFLCSRQKRREKVLANVYKRGSRTNLLISQSAFPRAGK